MHNESTCCSVSSKNCSSSELKATWTLEEAQRIYSQPFPDLIHQAQTVHRAHFNPNEVQRSTLLSVKTGGCPEDCAYCPQSAHFETGLKAEKLLPLHLNTFRAAVR